MFFSLMVETEMKISTKLLVEPYNPRFNRFSVKADANGIPFIVNGKCTLHTEFLHDPRDEKGHGFTEGSVDAKSLQKTIDYFKAHCPTSPARRGISESRLVNFLAAAVEIGVKIAIKYRPLTEEMIREHNQKQLEFLEGLHRSLSAPEIIAVADVTVAPQRRLAGPGGGR